MLDLDEIERLARAAKNIVLLGNDDVLAKAAETLVHLNYTCETDDDGRCIGAECAGAITVDKLAEYRKARHGQ